MHPLFRDPELSRIHLHPQIQNLNASPGELISMGVLFSGSGVVVVVVVAVVAVVVKAQRILSTGISTRSFLAFFNCW